MMKTPAIFTAASGNKMKRCSGLRLRLAALPNVCSWHPAPCCIRIFTFSS